MQQVAEKRTVCEKNKKSLKRMRAESYSGTGKKQAECL